MGEDKRNDKDRKVKVRGRNCCIMCVGRRLGRGVGGHHGVEGGSGGGSLARVVER